MSLTQVSIVSGATGLGWFMEIWGIKTWVSFQGALWCVCCVFFSWSIQRRIFEHTESVILFASFLKETTRQPLSTVFFPVLFKMFLFFLDRLFLRLFVMLDLKRTLIYSIKAFNGSTSWSWNGSFEFDIVQRLSVGPPVYPIFWIYINYFFF